jgi:proteasome accessory factor C
MVNDLSAPLLRTARLLDLVPYLHANQGISLKELASDFGVSSAQIQSDLTTLWMCGLPGYTPLELMDLEFDSGFVTIRNATTLSKPRKVSMEEGLALLLGLELLQQRLPLDRADLRKEIETLKKKLSSRVDAPKTVIVSAGEDHEVVQPLLESIKSSSRVEISYHSLYSDQITTRTVTPLLAYEEKGQKYLRAFCFLAMDYRIFRIDRILTLRILDKLNPRNKENLEGITLSAGSVNDGFSYSIKVLNTSREVAERFAIESHLKQMKLPYTTVELSSFSKEWILRAVLATASDVELIEPLDIRKEIAKRAQSLLVRYSDN